MRFHTIFCPLPHYDPNCFGFLCLRIEFDNSHAHLSHPIHPRDQVQGHQVASYSYMKVFKVFLDATFSCKTTQKHKGPNKKNHKASNSLGNTRNTQDQARRQQQQHHSTKTTQTAFGMYGRFVDHRSCKRIFQKREQVAISSTNIRSPLYAGRSRKLTDIKKNQSSSLRNSTDNNAALLVRRCTCCRCLLRWNTYLTNCNLKECEVCTDKNQSCGDSRTGPEKHQLVTV